MATPQSPVEAAFTAYTKLSTADRATFKTMLTGYDFKAATQSAAGRKAARTKAAAAASSSTTQG